MADPKAPEINGWKPEQYGGFARGNWDVDFDGEDIEVSVNVSGYGGYGDRMCLPLPVLCALLSVHGLHICSEADKRVLDACAALKPRSLEFWADFGNTEELKTVAVAERARRSGT